MLLTRSHYRGLPMLRIVSWINDVARRSYYRGSTTLLAVHITVDYRCSPPRTTPTVPALFFFDAPPRWRQARRGLTVLLAIHIIVD